MNKKNLDVKQLVNELHGASAFFKRPSDDGAAPSPKVPLETEPSSPAQPEAAVTQPSTQLSNRVSKPLSKNLSRLPSAEEIEACSFRLRKTNKVRVNADVPEDWQKELADLAYQLGVGKYELNMYILGVFLGKIDP